MKNRIGIIILVLIAVGLGIGLIWNQKNMSDSKRTAEEKISTISNQLEVARVELDSQRSVNAQIEGDLKKQREAFTELTNAFTQVALTLDQTENSLKQAKEEIAKHETRIADLESQNHELDARAADLSTAITNLTVQIDDTQRKLAASEGDKVFLEKELQRLMAEKAALERQFNDIAVLRAQVAKLREELSISRRIEWIRQGIFARTEQKGAEQLIARTPAIQPAARQNQHNYDLNVEVSADGTVRVIPPSTNAPANGSVGPQ